VQVLSDDRESWTEELRIASWLELESGALSGDDKRRFHLDLEESVRDCDLESRRPVDRDSGDDRILDRQTPLISRLGEQRRERALGWSRAARVNECRRT
jgi:hypothetical protein